MSKPQTPAEITERVAKLPEWARDYIAHLQNLAATRKVALDEFLAHQQPSKIYTESFEGVRFNVQDDEVRFEFGDQHISVRHKGDHLQIYGVPESLTILPHVSNVISLKLERR